MRSKIKSKELQVTDLNLISVPDKFTELLAGLEAVVPRVGGHVGRHQRPSKVKSFGDKAPQLSNKYCFDTE